MKTKTQTLRKLRSLAFAVLLTLVGVGAAPAQNQILLTDTFDTPDTFNLNDNLATRESGVLAPVPGYISRQQGLNDVIQITNNILTLTRLDNGGSWIESVSPDVNFSAYEVNQSFHVECDVSTTATNASDTWAALTVRGVSPNMFAVRENCFSVFVRSRGRYTIYDGTVNVANFPLATNVGNLHNIIIDVQTNVASVTIDGIPRIFADGTYSYVITNAIYGNYVSFCSYASSAAISLPAIATFNNLVVSVPQIPGLDLPASVVLADNFTTTNSASLNDNLPTRQSGTAATQTWGSAQTNGADFAISSDSLSITNTGDTSTNASFGTAFPNLDLRPYERYGSFHVSVAVSPVVGAGDSWGAVKVRQSDPTQWILSGNGFGVFVRPNGSWGITDGGNVKFTGFITPAATYLVDIEVITNMAYVKINGAPVHLGYALSSTQAMNYVSLMSNAGVGSAGVSATFTNFEFDALGTYAGLPAPSLLNTTSTAGTFSSQFSSAANAAYTLEYKNNLTDPAWTALYNIIGTGGTLTVTNVTAGTAQRFYRLHVP